MWGFGDPGGITNQDLFRADYKGKRFSFGYPACPDHSEKFKLCDLLDTQSIGISLPETAAMLPAASVSGLYLAHPESHYFSVGRIGVDQVENYARRKGATVEEVERWLGPALAYEPRVVTE